MKNKRLKISGGGVKLSTPIDLKAIESEIASLAGRTSSTPISMESLWNEVQNLKSTMKQWEIVTLSGDTKKGVYPFDSKYADWNFIVVTGEIGGYRGDYIGSYNRNYNSITVRKPSENRRQINGNWSKSGNSIITGGTLSDGYSKSSSITVLFYK